MKKKKYRGAYVSVYTSEEFLRVIKSDARELKMPLSRFMRDCVEMGRIQVIHDKKKKNDLPTLRQVRKVKT